jgi:GH25 family lysozyme M1 (1,4-beta-N-acetylmuramidase)
MDPMPFHVVDIAHGDHVTSFSEAAAAGIWGVIHKATTGGTGKDDAYTQRRQAALDAGLLWGAYHWGTAHAPVADQIDNFLTKAAPDNQTLVALDFEETEGNQMTLAQAREFLTLLEEQLGRKAVLYSANVIKEGLGKTIDPFFGGHRLWLAQYTPPVVVQASWQTYWLWQYTDNTKSALVPNGIAGIPGDDKGNLDCNAYNGTKDQLTAEWAS